MMKRIFIALLFIFSCIGAMAQNANEHLKFMGIPINGTLESFTQKLVAKGMKRECVTEDGVFLSGTFAGAMGCRILVYRLPSRNVVYKVLVCLPSRETWPWLEGEYNEFKKMLISKYGEPKSHSETFKEGTYTGSDNFKISALKGGKCQYASIWGLNEGMLALDIFSMESPSSCFVRLHYIDLINGKLAEDSKQNDL